ncbi:hypothetical protein HYU13_01915 [Candidatus Woesearchaeota archaeon]|nr:hypothetical protein [Candidatus Woesearchaeota archaeon]
MGKKGQLTLHSLMIGLFTLVAAGVLLFGLSAIKDYQASSEKLDLTSFESSLSNMVKKASKAAFGSIEEQVTALPSGADAVCFVDRTKNISPLVNCRLNDMIKVYEDKNVFLSPFQEFTPIALDGFELDGQENPLCLKAGRGIIRLSASSKGSTAALSTFDPSVKQQDCTQMVFNGNPNSFGDRAFQPEQGKDQHPPYRQI